MPGRRNRCACRVAVILLSSCLLARAQEPDEEQRRAMQEQLRLLNEASREIDRSVAEARKSGRLLAEVQALRALEKDFESKGAMAQQALALRTMQGDAALGNYESALRLADFGRPPHSPGGPSDGSALRGREATGALEALSELAKEHRIVLINEAHHQPQHRAFTLELLPRLRKIGFTHFAAETLFESDTELQERGYPTESTGAYTDEPVYGDLIRTALALGFTVVPYEAKSFGDPQERERGQADNLVRRVFDEEPEARLIVHAGYAHINESGTLAGARTMAQLLAERTEIDPLTVDQTVMSERGRPEMEHPLYRHVVDQLGIDGPVVFRDAEGAPWSVEPGVRDVTLFHPRSRLEQGRPVWLQMNGRRKPYSLPADVLGDVEHAIARARVAREGEDAIPIDRIELAAEQPPAVLLLPAGRFVVDVVDPRDDVIWTREIEVIGDR